MLVEIFQKFELLNLSLEQDIAKSLGITDLNAEDIVTAVNAVVQSRKVDCKDQILSRDSRVAWLLSKRFMLLLAAIISAVVFLYLIAWMFGTLQPIGIRNGMMVVKGTTEAVKVENSDFAVDAAGFFTKRGDQCHNNGTCLIKTVEVLSVYTFLKRNDLF